VSLYPSGYSNKLVTLDELRARHGSKMIPEYARRLFAMIEDARGLVGIGGGFRSYATQAANYARDPKTFAPPGFSFHESHSWSDGTVGYAAVDTVGIDGRHREAWDWIHENAARFGLVDFSNVNSEPWHVQMAEIPKSVREWKSAGRPSPSRFPLPSEEFVPVLDISAWQGATDFEKMKSAGIEGVILRAGNGKKVGIDERFAQYAKDASAAGLPFGAYYWVRPFAGDPEGQAANFLAEVAGTDARFLMLDIEWNETEIGPEATSEFLREFTKALRLAETVEGRVHIGYSSASYWDPNVGDDLLAYLLDWIVPTYSRGDEVPPLDPAEWSGWIVQSRKRPVAPRGAASWSGWQFSASLDGPHYGVSSSGLDGNLVRLSKWRKWIGETVEVEPPPPPTVPTPDPTPDPTPEGTDITVNVKLSKLSTKSTKALALPVKKWQGLLNAIAGQGLAVDGDFGSKTDEATRNFQRFFGLEVDGIVGPKTWTVALEVK